VLSVSETHPNDIVTSAARNSRFSLSLLAMPESVLTEQGMTTMPMVTKEPEAIAAPMSLNE
jgi:hypothetical protein